LVYLFCLTVGLGWYAELICNVTDLLNAGMQ
jgi:hypothetical protein